MIKYLNEIIISIFISIVVSGLIVYTTGNIIAGVSVFTAVLVTINFIINRYEMRNEATVDFMLTTDDKKTQSSRFLL